MWGIENDAEGRGVNLESHLKLYPSPTHGDFIYLDYQSPQSDLASILIYDMNAKLVKTKQWYVQKGENKGL